MVTALFDDADNLGDGLIRLGKFLAGGFRRVSALAVESIGFLRIGPHGLGSDLRRHHAIAQAGEDSGFQRLAVHGADVVAAVGEHMVDTGVAILPATGVGAFAAAAEQQAGKKGARLVGRVQPAIGSRYAPDGGAAAFDLLLVEAGQFILSRFGRVPQLLR